MYTASPSLDEDQPLVWLAVVPLAYPTISSIPYYCTVFIFLSLIKFCFMNETFLLHLSKELHVEIWSRRFFFPLHM